MEFQPYMTKESDRAFWVPAEVFQKSFDQDDFNCRDVHSVLNEYSPNWFFVADGIHYFELPTVIVVRGKTQLISGRHRIAVLLMNDVIELPIGFAEGKACELAECLKLKPIEELFRIPNLPFGDF